MKVLVTHELFPPECFRMGERIAFLVADELRKRGMDVKVVTTGNPKIKRYKGLPTIRLKMSRYMMNIAFPWIMPYAKDVDIIQTNNYNACLSSFIAGKLLDKPVVCLVHGMYGRKWLNMRGPILGRISMWMEKFQINHSYNKIIFMSEHARNEAINIGVPRKITKYIKPGIEFYKYKIKKKEPFVLFVGRLAKQKGLDYLLEAARAIPNVKFIIAGEGEQEKELKSKATDNVKFVGFVSGDRLIDLYSRALIFCLPSIGETLGFVHLEAMASGCAIVSTIPLDYEGITVKPADSKQLKEAIEKLVKNPDMAIRMGKKNREKAKTYRWDSFIDELIKVYEEVKS